MPQDSKPPLRFGIGELAGSLGDFGTILPLSLALAATGALGIGPVLLFLGIWFIITGYYYLINLIYLLDCLFNCCFQVTAPK